MLGYDLHSSHWASGLKPASLFVNVLWLLRSHRNNIGVPFTYTRMFEKKPILASTAGRFHQLLSFTLYINTLQTLGMAALLPFFYHFLKKEVPVGK
jgi:hypothetical protein